MRGTPGTAEPQRVAPPEAEVLCHNKSILQKSRELSLSYHYIEKLQKQMLIAIYTDRLTGLHNRRKFEEMVNCLPRMRVGSDAEASGLHSHADLS